MIINGDIYLVSGLKKVVKDAINQEQWEYDGYSWLVVSNMTFIVNNKYMGCHPSHWRTHIFLDG